MPTETGCLTVLEAINTLPSDTLIILLDTPKPHPVLMVDGKGKAKIHDPRSARRLPIGMIVDSGSPMKNWKVQVLDQELPSEEK